MTLYYSNPLELYCFILFSIFMIAFDFSTATLSLKKLYSLSTLFKEFQVDPQQFSVLIWTVSDIHLKFVPYHR